MTLVVAVVPLWMGKDKATWSNRHSKVMFPQIIFFSLFAGNLHALHRSQHRVGNIFIWFSENLFQNKTSFHHFDRFCQFSKKLMQNLKKKSQAGTLVLSYYCHMPFLHKNVKICKEPNHVGNTLTFLQMTSVLKVLLSRLFSGLSIILDIPFSPS